MHSPLTRGTRRLVRGTQNMLSQIIVSVAAAVCVAFITNAYLGGGAERAASPVTEPAIAGATAPALPPLQVEIVADAPNVAVPGQEIFPGVPAGVPLDKLQQTVSTEKKRERRRFLGIPLPFTSTEGAVAESDATPGAEIDALVGGG